MAGERAHCARTGEVIEMSGKGDKPRHNLAKYGEGWERVFGKKADKRRPSWGARRKQAMRDKYA